MGRRTSAVSAPTAASPSRVVALIAVGPRDELVASLSHDNVVRFFDPTNAGAVKSRRLRRAALRRPTTTPSRKKKKAKKGDFRRPWQRALTYAYLPMATFSAHGRARGVSRMTSSMRRPRRASARQPQPRQGPVPSEVSTASTSGSTRVAQCCRSYGCARALICRSLMRRLLKPRGASRFARSSR